MPLTLQPCSTCDAAAMYLRPASSAQVTASASGCLERTLASFTSIGRLTPAITSTPFRSIIEMARLRRRAAEHVGQQHDPVAGVAPADTGLDLGAAVFDVVVRPDTDRVDVALRADHMLHGGAQFLGQPAVGHQDHADHVRTEVSQTLAGLSANGR